MVYHQIILSTWCHASVKKSRKKTQHHRRFNTLNVNKSARQCFRLLKSLSSLFQIAKHTERSLSFSCFHHCESSFGVCNQGQIPAPAKTPITVQTVRKSVFSLLLYTKAKRNIYILNGSFRFEQSRHKQNDVSTWSNYLSHILKPAFIR